MNALKQLPALTLSCPRVWDTLVDQLRTAVTKAGFWDVGLGLSGGIDSALVATLAVDAFGAEHVHGVLMPSSFSSQGSVTDALSLASNLGISTNLISIVPMYEAFITTLAPHFQGTERDITEENLQARIRGTLLMAFSNKFDYFVLATGNRSEALAGYATLHGDMVGGYAPIGTLYKTHVYELARWKNDTAQRPVIPQDSIDKEPSAELSVGQLDRHALPPYDVLDAIYYYIIDKGETAEQLISEGFSREDVENAVNRQEKSSFKRTYAAPSPKLDIYQK